MKATLEEKTMMCYKDKTFCPSENPLCIGCEDYFDEAKYKRFCRGRGDSVPLVSFYVEIPKFCKRFNKTDNNIKYERINNKNEKTEQ